MKSTFVALFAVCAAVVAAAPAADAYNIRKPEGICEPGTRGANCVHVRDTTDTTDDSDSGETDQQLAIDLATALAADDEDYDKQPDGVDDATYLADLAAKDAIDDTVPA